LQRIQQIIGISGRTDLNAQLAARIRRFGEGAEIQADHRTLQPLAGLRDDAGLVGM